MRIQILLIAVLLLSILLVTAGCAPGGGRYGEHRTAGFLAGIWHGWIAPVSLIVGIFNPDIRVYETHNSGWWYDFGFYISIIAGFGSLSLTRRKKRYKD